MLESLPVCCNRGVNLIWSGTLDVNCVNAGLCVCVKDDAGLWVWCCPAPLTLGGRPGSQPGNLSRFITLKANACKAVFVLVVFPSLELQSKIYLMF